MSLTLDAGLNLLWLGISVAALAWVGRFDLRWSGGIRGDRLFAVFLATIALFPIVSDSDDLFNFSLLQIHGQPHGAGTTPEDSREKDSLHLARVLKSIDHFQISAFYQITLALYFVALLLTLSFAVHSRAVFESAGRAPPLP